MKRKLAWIGAILSGLYLLTVGPIPDPIPFIDEAAALAIFLKCTSYLGFDLGKWLPFIRKKGKSNTSRRAERKKDVIIDV